MKTLSFQDEIRAGIPDVLPEMPPYDPEVNHAPKRKDILTPEQKKAVKSVTKGDRKKETAPRKREVKPDLVKREIIETVAQNLDRCFFDNAKIHSMDNIHLKECLFLTTY